MTINFVYIFIAINSFFKGIGYSSDNYIYISLMTITFLFAVPKVIKYKLTVKEFFYVFFLIILGLINYLVGHSSVILFTSLTLLLLKDEDIVQCLKVVLFSRIAGGSVLLFGAIIGFFPQSQVVMWRIDHLVTRKSINGFAPNVLQMNLVLVILLIICLYMNKLNVVHYIIMAVLNISLYFYTLSRTGMLIGMLTIILGFCLPKYNLIRQIILKIARYSYLIIGLFSFWTAIFYNANFIFLNNLFNGRLNYMHLLVTSYFPPLFGTNHSYFTEISIDNGYTALLYTGGILAFVIISYLMISESNRLYLEKGNDQMLLMILILSIYSLTESFLPNIFVNFSLFLLSWRIYGKDTYRNGTNLLINKTM